MFLRRLDTPAVSKVPVEGLKSPNYEILNAQTEATHSSRPYSSIPLALMGYYMWPQKRDEP